MVPSKSENRKEIPEFVQKHIKEGAILHSDKSKGFSVLNECYKDIEGNPVKKYKYTLWQEKSDKEKNPMKWLHTPVSNLKDEIKGIYHGIPPKFLNMYIAEYTWRYNHRGIRSNKEKDENTLIKGYRVQTRCFKEHVRKIQLNLYFKSLYDKFIMKEMVYQV